MPASANTLTERSPLLNNNYSDTSVEANARANLAPTVSEANDEESDANDQDGLQRTHSADDRAKQYEGMPDVLKRMPYIFPALAIGEFLSSSNLHHTLAFCSCEGV